MGVSGCKRFFRLSFYIILFLSMLMSSLANSAGNVSSEYKLKAALLYKLTKFVEWPADQQNKKVFGLCVLGDNPFDQLLETLESRKVAKKAISVHYFELSEAVKDDCDLVFISYSKQAFLKSILENLKGKPVLTVGDSNGFSDQGGVIELTSGNRIGFKINIKRARENGLKIAAPLLQLATIVESQD